MQLKPVLILCLAVAVPELAMADLADTNPKSAGMVHALLNFCSSVDPKDRAAYQAEWASIVGGVPSHLQPIESNAAYQQGYAMVYKLLSGMPYLQAAKNCADGATQWRAGEKAPKADPDREPVPDREPITGHHDLDRK